MVQKYITPYTAKVLPTVYDDSLSYYEVVNQLVAKINEVIDELDNVAGEVLDEAKAYTDSAIEVGLAGVNEKIAEINRLINQINESYADFVEHIGTEMDEFKADVNRQIFEINRTIDALDDKFTSEIESTNLRTVTLIQQNNEFLLREMTKYLSQITVVNYFTGERVSIQDMFDYLAMLHLDDSINYNVMAARSKTYTQLAGLNMSYTNLVLHGNTLYV